MHTLFLRSLRLSQEKKDKVIGCIIFKDSVSHGMIKYLKNFAVDILDLEGFIHISFVENYSAYGLSIDYNVGHGNFVPYKYLNENSVKRFDFGDRENRSYLIRKFIDNSDEYRDEKYHINGRVPWNLEEIDEEYIPAIDIEEIGDTHIVYTLQGGNTETFEL